MTRSCLASTRSVGAEPTSGKHNKVGTFSWGKGGGREGGGGGGGERQGGGRSRGKCDRICKKSALCPRKVHSSKIQF